MSDAAPEGRERPSPQPGRLPTRLLYVEDDNDLRDMIADTLVEAGFVVTPVPSAEAAMTSLRGARFDILVTDYHLLGATGVWLLESATAAGLLEGTAAIMLTSGSSPLQTVWPSCDQLSATNGRWPKIASHSETQNEN